MNGNLEKKYLILEKAKDMIISEGYSNISINKLTSELGISKGNFYTYFNSKDEMLGEILDEYKNRTLKYIDEINERSNSMKEYIENSVNSILEQDEEDFRLELVILNLKKNFEILSVENFKKFKAIAEILMNNIMYSLKKYKSEIKIEEKDFQRCARLFYVMSKFYFDMGNIDFNKDEFSLKSLDEIKVSYESEEMKDNLEFIKKRIINLLN